MRLPRIKGLVIAAACISLATVGGIAAGMASASTEEPPGVLGWQELNPPLPSCEYPEPFPIMDASDPGAAAVASGEVSAQATSRVRVKRNGKKVELSDLKPGDRVRVVASGSGTVIVATSGKRPMKK